MHVPERERSRVLLIGSSEYEFDLAPLPAVRRDVADLANALTLPNSGVFGRRTLQTLLDRSRTEVVDAVMAAAAQTLDTLLLYFAGHADLGKDDELYLFARDTSFQRSPLSAIPFRTMREAMQDSPARHKVVILDCCYSGRAVERMSHDATLIALDLRGRGIFVLSSASSLEMARSKSEHTAFAGQLLNVLERGIAGEGEMLAVETIAAEVRRFMLERGLQSPIWYASDGGGEVVIARNAAYEPSPSLPMPQPTWFVPGFSGENTDGPDLLGVDEDAGALAVLLASSALQPPIAVGLHGNWGSGKTFFMKALERNVGQLTSAAEDDPTLPFVRRVRHVWFNAWHYAEGNLWASLLHHVFVCLQGEGPSKPQQILDEALAQLSGIRSVTQDAKTKVTAAERVAELARDEAERLAGELDRARRDVAQIRALDVWETLRVDDKLRSQFNKVAESIGIPAAGASARDLSRAVDDAREIASSTQRLATSGRWSRSPLVVGLLVAAGVAVAGLLLGRLLADRGGALATTATIVAQAVALASGAATWITRQSNLARRILAPAQRIKQQLDKRLAEATAQQERDRDAAIERLAAAHHELESVRVQLGNALSRESEAAAELADLTGPRLLERYLSERVSSVDYGQYLGVVAMAHRDLRDLDAYLRATASGGAGPIDRIVLYVDDLDRCPPETVVKVLEAVHLLLALPLFVVVVGVDARWLAESLRDRRSLLLHRTEPDDVPDVRRTGTRDYLDKIFQLTYQMPEMTTDRCVELLRHVALADGRVDAVVQPTAQPGTSDPETELLETPLDEPGGPTAPLGGARALAAVLTLGQDEMDWFAEVAPLIGSSPRQAKRFLNVYRVVKARAVLGRDSDRLPLDYSNGGLILLTALVMGLPNALPHAVSGELQPMTMAKWLSQMVTPTSADEALRLTQLNSTIKSLGSLDVQDVLSCLAIARPFIWPVSDA
jgi:hypothetical protein